MSHHRQDPLDALLQEGFQQHQRGDLASAEQCYRRILHFRPDHADGLYLLGLLAHQVGRHDRAVLLMERALRHVPGTPDAYVHLGCAYRAMNNVERAEACFRQALALAPNHGDAWNQLGLLYKDRCQLAAATKAFQNSLAGQPGNLQAARNHLLLLQYLPDLDEETRFSQHVRFAATYADKTVKIPRPFANSVDPHRPLRVGYVSSDFRDHVIAFNLLPILENHNRRQFEIYAYANVAKPDPISQRIRGLVMAWRDISRMDDQEAAQQIRQDGMDVLIFLAGHFDGNRLLLAHHRAAPVQISWHDCATSGLERMDYLLADPVMVPVATRERFVERVVRLPTMMAYAPIEDAPDLLPPPMVTSAVFTFGCFNNPAKLNPAVLAVWGRLLQRLPSARLFLKYQDAYTDPILRHSLLNHFAGMAVAPHRIVFNSGYHSRKAHLAWYQHVDISLDPFPFCGATTTFESLWMGVPVVVRPGSNMMSRLSASMLHDMKLEAWVARDDDDYLAIAENLARNQDALVDWRKKLRDRLRISSICNGKLKTRHLERVLRHLCGVNLSGCQGKAPAT